MTNYALIADPDMARASSYAALFREEGLTCIVVRDGVFAAATLLERGAPDLLLTELSLPRIDGFELIEKLRRSELGDRTPVIVVSASRELRETADDLRVRLGIGAILAKAASDESVRRVLKRLLGDKLPGPPDAATRPTPPAPAGEAACEPTSGPPTPGRADADRTIPGVGAPGCAPALDADLRARPTVRMPTVDAIRRRMRM